MAASRPRRPWRNSALESEPPVARSTRPPGVSTEFPKLNTDGSAPRSPFTASWQDMPPPESMPAHSASDGLPRPGHTESSWTTASHSALPSSRPLRTLKCARSPNDSPRRCEKARSCRSLSAPVSSALRTPAVAPTSTRPDGSCSAKRSTKPAARPSSWSATASGSARQEDFSLRTTGRPSTCASVKWMPRVDPLPQSTTAIGAGWPHGRPPPICGSKSTAPSTPSRSEPPRPPSLGASRGTPSCSSGAGCSRLLAE
mmetsp:Transcript_77896/g.240488  ORF Transcript_77896/g.240488 Transcript_77896/m.240488 type:complete len:257 (-) Transcript_77896:315-1085(-)